jgi:CubicO group peptidase (beta-lactamase class C family)
MKQGIILGMLLIFSANLQAQTYFPPNTGTWQTTDPSTLGWCTPQIEELYTYLDQTHSKAFILLKDGKIVLERYFGTFTQDSAWLWNSAGKTLTGLAVGIAQSEGHLSISDTTSDYLGTGWTSLTPQQEEKITIRHQLTMTSGLDDSENFDCTDPECLTYMADPGNRWAYHNAPYTLLDGVIENATGQTLNAYVTQKIKAPIGMTGLYLTLGYNHIFASNARSMARFGLLLMAEGVWNGNDLLGDPAYFQAMTHTSQSINPSYGYLTWLTGQASYMIPQSQIHIPGNAMPNSPAGTYAALGKDGQLINVDPQHQIVFIRMGQDDGNSLVSTQYNDTIWQKINLLSCTNSLTETTLNQSSVYPNPAQDVLTISSEFPVSALVLINACGQEVTVQKTANSMQLSALPKGLYFLQVIYENRREVHKIIHD